MENYSKQSVIDTERLTSEDDSYSRYSKVCYAAATSEIVFRNFKTHPGYTYELEHTSKELGDNYIRLAKQEFGDILEKLDWKKISANDIHGGTRVTAYWELSDYCGKDCKFSPTTIGYLYLAIRMCKNLQSKNFDSPIDVVELGAGYGGQCYLFCTIAEFMGISINSYTLVDLYHANLLQETYLNKLNLNEKVELRFLSGKNYEEYRKEVGNVDFVISNYALSEISIDWGKRYLETFIKKSTYGFFQFNTCHKPPESGEYENLTVEHLATHYTNISNTEDPGNPDGVPGGGHKGCRLLVCEV